MKINKCPYCGSDNLVLDEKRKDGQQALICGNCGKWLKWCPKEERRLYKQEGEQISIAELQKMVHQNAKDHGWWDKERTPGELLMLVTSEVAEAFEEVRNGKEMTETYYSEDGKMEGVPSELADIVIRVLDLSEHYGIDLQAAIIEKHNFNKSRPYRHGGKEL